MLFAANIALRDVREADLPLLYQIQKEPEGYQMAVVKPRDEEAFYRHWRTNVLSHPDVIIKTIEIEGEVAGDVTSFILNGERAVGYWIAQKFWGRGIASAAVRELLVSYEKRRPLCAFVATSNLASYRVLEKCGFRRVGAPTRASDGVEEFKMVLAAL